MIKIKALTKKTLKEAINLADAVFPALEQEAEPASIVFSASLNPEKYRDFLSKTMISELRYWLAVDDFGKVMGTIGLYCYGFDKNEAFWIGWFCVDPSARNKGVGTRLLRFSIEEARRKGKKFLRLWTTTNPDESVSHELYRKHGFVKLAEEETLPHIEFKKLYYELKL